jgi:hypothetical protein
VRRLLAEFRSSKRHVCELMAVPNVCFGPEIDLMRQAVVAERALVLEAAVAVRIHPDSPGFRKHNRGDADELDCDQKGRSRLPLCLRA